MTGLPYGMRLACLAGLRRNGYWTGVCQYLLFAPSAPRTRPDMFLHVDLALDHFEVGLHLDARVGLEPQALIERDRSRQGREAHVVDVALLLRRPDQVLHDELAEAEPPQLHRDRQVGNRNCSRGVPHDEEAAERGEVVGGQQRQPAVRLLGDVRKDVVLEGRRRQLARLVNEVSHPRVGLGPVECDVPEERDVLLGRNDQRGGIRDARGVAAERAEVRDARRAQRACPRRRAHRGGGVVEGELLGAELGTVVMDQV
mmetsp:Transcript_51051/g.150513  ORF Transcript_51051/g.150513 Transcript_51051/m.150513 type:complete len:257 (-) Transcript_51051:127-897(-)